MDTKRNIAIWLALGVAALAFETEIDWTVWLFLLAPLVLVPIGFEVVEGPAVLRGLLMFSACFVATSFLMPVGMIAGLLAAAWLLAAVAVAFSNALVFVVRPTLARACFAIAGIDLVFAAGWLVVSRLGVEPMGFEEPIVLLTAVHFHFAGFVNAVIVGALVRGGARRPVMTVATIGVLICPYLVAVGFVVSTGVKFLAIAALASCLVVVAVMMIANRRLFPIEARPWLVASGSSIVLGMVLACVYGWGEYVAVEFIDIPQMARFHGTLNALGFGFCGLRAAGLITGQVRKSEERRLVGL